MSKERKDRKKQLNKRVQVKKGYICTKCNNDKVHTNGLKYKCTKCKSENVNFYKS